MTTLLLIIRRLKPCSFKVTAAFVNKHGTNSFLGINNLNADPKYPSANDHCQIGLLCIYLPFLSFGKVTSFEEEILFNCRRLISQEINKNKHISMVLKSKNY